MILCAGNMSTAIGEAVCCARDKRGMGHSKGEGELRENPVLAQGVVLASNMTVYHSAKNSPQLQFLKRLKDLDWQRVNLCELTEKDKCVGKQDHFLLIITTLKHVASVLRRRKSTFIETDG